MVEVSISESDRKIIIRLRGHAGKGKKGEDIVCAGISGVLQFIVIHLFNKLDKKGKFHLSSGSGVIEVDKDEDSIKIVNSFLEYLDLVAKSYPNTLLIKR